MTDQTAAPQRDALHQQITAALQHHRRAHERTMYCTCGAWTNNIDSHRAEIITRIVHPRLDTLHQQLTEAREGQAELGRNVVYWSDIAKHHQQWGQRRWNAWKSARRRANEQRQRAEHAEAATATPRELALRQRSAWVTAGRCPMCGWDGTDGRLCTDCTSTVRAMGPRERREWRRYEPPANETPLQSHGYTAAGLLGLATETCGATTIGMYGRTLGPCLHEPHPQSGWHRDARGTEWREYEAAPADADQAPQDTAATEATEPSCTCGGPHTSTTLPSGTTYEEHRVYCAVMAVDDEPDDTDLTEGDIDQMMGDGTPAQAATERREQPDQTG